MLNYTSFYFFKNCLSSQFCFICQIHAWRIILSPQQAFSFASETPIDHLPKSPMCTFVRLCANFSIPAHYFWHRVPKKFFPGKSIKLVFYNNNDKTFNDQNSCRNQNLGGSWKKNCWKVAAEFFSVHSHLSNW